MLERGRSSLARHRRIERTDVLADPKQLGDVLHALADRRRESPRGSARARAWPSSRGSARSTWASSRNTCTGMRTVRPWCKTACCTACADPPHGVGRKTQASLRLEFLDRADQADIAFLDQVHQRHAATDVAAGHRHDEAQIRFDHAPSRFAVARAARVRQAPIPRSAASSGDQADFVQIGARSSCALPRRAARWHRAVRELPRLGLGTVPIGSAVIVQSCVRDRLRHIACRSRRRSTRR